MFLTFFLLWALLKSKMIRGIIFYGFQPNFPSGNNWRGWKRNLRRDIPEFLNFLGCFQEHAFRWRNQQFTSGNFFLTNFATLCSPRAKDVTCTIWETGPAIHALLYTYKEQHQLLQRDHSQKGFGLTTTLWANHWRMLQFSTYILMLLGWWL